MCNRGGGRGDLGPQTDKHLAAKYIYWSIFKKCRHLGFGVFIDIWSMVTPLLFLVVDSKNLFKKCKLLFSLLDFKLKNSQRCVLKWIELGAFFSCFYSSFSLLVVFFSHTSLASFLVLIWDWNVGLLCEQGNGGAVRSLLRHDNHLQWSGQVAIFK